MNLKQIKPGTMALLVGGLFMLLVGTYTGNGGFQFAGVLLLLVSTITALHQASSRQSAD